MNLSPTPHQPKPTPSAPSGGCLRWLLFSLVWFWVVSISLLRLGFQLFASAVLTQVPDTAWVGFPLVQGVLLFFPLLLLANFTRSQPWRAIYRSWAAAAFFVLLLAPVSLTFASAMQLHAVLNLFLALIFTAVIIAVSRRDAKNRFAPENPTPPPSERPSIRPLYLIALAIAGAFAWSWFAWGALGSPDDSLLQLLSGLALGLAFSVALQSILLPGFQTAQLSPQRLFAFGGACASVALLIFASGVGYAFGGIQLLLAICLPPLGWVAIRLFQLAGLSDSPELSTWRSLLSPAALLIGATTAIPLMMIDPDELALVISFSQGEILVWGLTAAGFSAGIGFVIALIFGFTDRLRRHQTDAAILRNSAIIPVFLLISWLAGFAIYFTLGQPGFYGEGLLVVLRDQADVSPAIQIKDINQRRNYVFDALVRQANASQAELRAALERFGIGYTPYYLVNAIQVDGGPIIRLWLNTRPEVDRVLDNPFMRPLPQSPPVASGKMDKPESPQWNLTQIDAVRVWEEFGVRGRGIVIGQSDSGVQFDHPELFDSYRGRDGNHNYDWFDPWYGNTQPTDIGGHGTHTLGSILGNATGVAPDAEWIACANLARNLGNPGYYLDCMQFMLAPFPIGGDAFTDGDPTRGAHILNNSWGCPSIEGCDAHIFFPAVRALTSAGVFIVASAGNDGPLCQSLKDPLAIYEDVLAVGATDSTGGLAFFSSIGPVTVDGSNRVKPDLIAPGDQVLSSFPNNTYAKQSGTSMAGPHAAGVVALMWSANPRLVGDIPRTLQILRETAQPYRGPLPDCPQADSDPSVAVGYGVLDAYAAVQAAMQSP